MQKHFVTRVFLALILSFPAALFAASTHVSALPELNGSQLLWQIHGEHGSAELRVVRPDGHIEVRSVGPGEDRVAFGIGGDALPEGTYLWELSLAPRLTEAQRSSLQRARDQGAGPPDHAGLRGQRARGSFRIVAGRVHGIAGAATEEPGAIERAGAASTPQAAPVAGSLTVRPSLCVGSDCADSESYGFDTVRMREDNLRVAFLDDSTTAGYAAGDWQLRINDSTNGGADFLAIDWLGTASDGSANNSPVSTPFRVDGGAPTDALYLDGSGRIGLGTPSPATELNIRDGDSPTLRLEQDTSSGFAAQTWDLAGNETSFFVRDSTNGSTLPFRIRPGASSNALVVSTDSSVGIGILSPEARLHVAGDARVDGALYQLSSRSEKIGFERPDAAALLERVERLWLGYWQYKDHDQGARHFGPTAEDFHATFGLGGDERHISVADMAGIALGATQALREEIERRDATITDLNRRLERLEAALDEQPLR